MTGGAGDATRFEPDELIDALVAAVPAAAGRRDRVRVVRAPGRVNLIGEHTDYNLGFVLPAAIDLEIRIAYLPTDDGRVELTRLDDGERDGFDLEADRPRTGTWLDYVAGTAWALGEAGLPLRGPARRHRARPCRPHPGCRRRPRSSSPRPGRCSTRRRRRSMPMTLARICQRAENVYVGVQCGLMDQFASSCGVDGSAVLLDCRSLEWRPVALPDGVVIVVLHTGSPRSLNALGVQRATAPVRAGRRRARPRRPLDRLAARRDAAVARGGARRGWTPSPIGGRATSSPRTSGSPRPSTRSRPGTSPRSGRLFAASHASLRDDFEVVSPELDAMVEIASAVPGRRRRADDRRGLRGLHGEPGPARRRSTRCGPRSSATTRPGPASSRGSCPSGRRPAPAACADRGDTPAGPQASPAMSVALSAPTRRHPLLTSGNGHLRHP